MARFYARFDSGSPSWNPTAATTVLLGTSTDGFFQTRSIAATSASGALLRNGLIASRSAISTDIYVELDLINQSGGRGTYFPPDTFVVTSGVLTGSVYTSSVAGIVIPANYRTRPTASISSTSPLVTASSPPDSASVTYDVYVSGSTAVKNVLDGIVGGGPYARLGNVPSRTLYSIWHDENLQYFAWDDFTPGAVVGGTVTGTIDCLTLVASPAFGTYGGTASISWNIANPTYRNDVNPNAKMYIYTSTDQVDWTQLAIVNAEDGGYNYIIGPQTSTGDVPPTEYIALQFADAVITNSFGSLTQASGNITFTAGTGTCQNA